VITLADDQGGTLDVKLLELLCFTRTRYNSRVARALKKINDGLAKSMNRGCRPIWSKRNKQTVRQALAWAAATLCRNSRAATAVLVIGFIFQKSRFFYIVFLVACCVMESSFCFGYCSPQVQWDCKNCNQFQKAMKTTKQKNTNNIKQRVCVPLFFWTDILAAHHPNKQTSSDSIQVSLHWVLFFFSVFSMKVPAVGVPLESALNLVSLMGPCGAHATHFAVLGVKMMCSIF